VLETDTVVCDAGFVDSFSVEGRAFIDAGLISSQIKKILREKGIPEEVVRKVAVVTFEAEVNIISYAEVGTISFQIAPDAITIEAVDKGPGIPDIDLALQEGYSTADDTIRDMGFGAGMGLPNIKKFSDIFEIKSEVGEGTYLKSIIRINGSP
jgi:anti-sigma regulatory factor (Ser/Thr protein kinase)